MIGRPSESTTRYRPSPGTFRVRLPVLLVLSATTAPGLFAASANALATVESLAAWVVAASVPASSRPFALSAPSPALARAAFSHACAPAALVTFVPSIFPLALASA